MTQDGKPGGAGAFGGVGAAGMGATGKGSTGTAPGTGTGTASGTGAASGPPADGAASGTPRDGEPRRLYRSSHGRIVGGVAQGLAAHLGLPVVWVRVTFAILGMFNGMGLLLYAAFWAFVPLGMDDETVGRDAADREGPPRRHLLLGGMLLLVVLTVVTRFAFGPSYLLPLVIAAVGVIIVWRQADDVRRDRWMHIGATHAGVRAIRSVLGAGLLLAGVIAFLVMQGSGRYLVQVLEASLAIVVGLLLLAGPYLARFAQELGAERRARIRAQERAEVAAHVHDSVLHTLTLIQRHADDPREVLRLARSQERELRAWLYRPDGDTTAEEGPSTLAEAVRAVAGEVEDAHGVQIEVVCVGDCPLDERLGAQLQAAREAMVNAAKYGGSEPVQVYAEVEEREVLIFVRDRGPGFDPDTVPEDRLGVRESIIGRMRRNGGTARVRSTPGEGTEIELEMERAVA
ncbi:PspC domain-containing protein [Allostreptomyces psammosilenae]|uniref:Signal transduction histidine kinase n=1 Tax=Allostreptomyces psammosilenae TaxID=1892865 RepID=A0A853A0I2_9ACTN|nr:PspC domain-containing protein [Allostreptomyces psammosilenae]NYI07889.1 signal transduction histidine kinase [Allostreptomyces psammosilenae]